jgi:hypothetical protein
MPDGSVWSPRAIELTNLTLGTLWRRPTSLYAGPEVHPGPAPLPRAKTRCQYPMKALAGSQAGWDTVERRRASDRA